MKISITNKRNIVKKQYRFELAFKYFRIISFKICLEDHNNNKKHKNKKQIQDHPFLGPIVNSMWIYYEHKIDGVKCVMSLTLHGES